MPSELTRTVQAGLPEGFPVVEAKVGQKVSVEVDVNEMQVPYTVSYDGDVIMHGFTDRKEALPIEPGVHRLGWSFQHHAKGWAHTIKVRVGRKVHTLESRSEDEKDKPYSVGLAFVVVEEAGS